MSDLRTRVSTVVLLTFENRSFDHMLGHLALEGLVPEVDGLTAPLSRYQNFYGGDAYAPFRARDRLLDADLPHEWDEVEVMLARSPVTQRCTMTGFVEAYARYRKMANVGPCPDPMGFFPSDQVPVTSFLARSFLTCDRWFCPLPTSTQPNRLMAWSGESAVHDTKARLVPCEETVLDWLDRAGVRWRVYHDGLSFFALFPGAWKHLLGGGFRDYEYYLLDMLNEPAASGPQVILVEPSYQDAPHLGSDRPNDNHAPLAVAWGEEFLRRTYEAARANPRRWAKTVMVVTYDENGGFFDHVAPLPVKYTTAGEAPHAFATTGPRVPAVVISPLVQRGGACHLPLDHTSVLQLLAELFTPGRDYSPAVRARRDQGIVSLSAALAPREQRGPSLQSSPPPPSLPIPAVTTLGRTLMNRPTSGMRSAFEEAALQLMAREPKRTARKYPELYHWKAAADLARGEQG